MPRNVPISVIIPAYNCQQFLPGCLETIRSQTVEVDEIIVADDGSTDDSVAVAERLGARVLKVEHGGPGGARNAGMAAATSEWIALLDADDVWHSQKLELQYDAVLAEPDVGLVFTDFDAISADDGTIHRSSIVSTDRSFIRVKRTSVTPHAGVLDNNDFLQDLPVSNLVLPSSAMFRRDLALEIGGFALTGTTGAEDLEFFLRLAARTSSAFIDIPLVAYMRHTSQITANRDLDAVRLQLHQQVMANRDCYHDLVVAGFRKSYSNALYCSAANAFSKREVVYGLALLLKAVIAATFHGELPALIESIGRSRMLSPLRKTPSVADSFTAGASGDWHIKNIEIPWRVRPTTHLKQGTTT